MGSDARVARRCPVADGRPDERERVLPELRRTVRPLEPGIRRVVVITVFVRLRHQEVLALVLVLVRSGDVDAGMSRGGIVQMPSEPLRVALERYGVIVARLPSRANRVTGSKLREDGSGSSLRIGSPQPGSAQ
jgi:hypothetical protein